MLFLFKRNFLFYNNYAAVLIASLETTSCKGRYIHNKENPKKDYKVATLSMQHYAVNTPRATRSIY